MTDSTEALVTAKLLKLRETLITTCLERGLEPTSDNMDKILDEGIQDLLDDGTVTRSDQGKLYPTK